jgi:lysophospholipase L1-like esterase
MYLEKNDFILFTGDSITDAGRKRPLGEGLWDGVGNGFVKEFANLLNAFYPELNVRITNTGISGDTSRIMKCRWHQDVLDLKPDWVVLCIGVNDVWRQFDEPSLTYQHIMPEEYEDNLRQLFETGKGVIKKGIIAMTPYYMEPLKEDAMRKRMDEYGAICKSVAAEFGAPCIDLQAIFDEYFTKRHSSYITWDRVHPAGAACTLMAKAVLEQFGLKLSLE